MAPFCVSVWVNSSRRCTGDVHQSVAVSSTWPSGSVKSNWPVHGTGIPDQPALRPGAHPAEQ